MCDCLTLVRHRKRVEYILAISSTHRGLKVVCYLLCDHRHCLLQCLGGRREGLFRDPGKGRVEEVKLA